MVLKILLGGLYLEVYFPEKEVLDRDLMEKGDDQALRFTVETIKCEAVMNLLQ